MTDLQEIGLVMLITLVSVLMLVAAGYFFDNHD